MKEFYIEAIKEMENYISNENFYTKKEFGKMTGLNYMSTKKQMIKSLKSKIEEYRSLLKNV